MGDRCDMCDAILVTFHYNIFYIKSLWIITANVTLQGGYREDVFTREDLYV